MINMSGDDMTIGMICPCCGKEITIKELKEFED